MMRGGALKDIHVPKNVFFLSDAVPNKKMCNSHPFPPAQPKKFLYKHKSIFKFNHG